MNSPPNDIEIIFSRLQLSAENGLSANHSQETPNKKYALVKIILGEGNRRKALISSGIHGDEPSGVETSALLLKTTSLKNLPMNGS